ncbi:unnamed protein product [Calicophoron daubneyi]|uniref:Interferon-related developmental regulator 1 n=1 Tax=Calicophoron daubneyi TaxID=300641 RepID=A0AAV2TKH1_CALDB
MPKKVKVNKAHGDDADGDLLENASVISLASEGSETPTSSSTEVEDLVSLQNTLERINAASECLVEKRPDTRIKALNFLINAFRMHYLCLDESWNYSATFVNGIENVLKKGKPQDQTLAAECLAIGCLQFDTQSISEHFVRFLPILETAIKDVSAPCRFRGAAAMALAVLQFLAGHCDFVSPKDLMKTLETVFKGSCLKGDGKAPTLDPSVTALHVAALKAWGLLFTLLPQFDIGLVGKPLLPNLLSLLQGTSVDMRIAAGEITALIYERIRNEVDDRFKGPYYSDLVRILNELATDGTKSRSKVDRKKQRHSFRELVDLVEHFEISETSVNFGSEVLVLGSCTEHFHYDLLCGLLKGGLSRHLQENCQVRNLFDLGIPVVITQSLMDRRAARNQRRMANMYAAKIRTQKLSTRRDRRSNVVVEAD